MVWLLDRITYAPCHTIQLQRELAIDLWWILRLILNINNLSAGPQSEFCMWGSCLSTVDSTYSGC